jgi:uncharacterized DUF497 family protein
MQWDEAKNAANIAKHGIDFIEASLIFERPVVEKIDTRRDYGEIRLLAIGLLDDRELTVIYTIRGEHRRIISARRSYKHERRTYRQVHPRG